MFAVLIVNFAVQTTKTTKQFNSQNKYTYSFLRQLHDDAGIIDRIDLQTVEQKATANEYSYVLLRYFLGACL